MPASKSAAKATRVSQRKASYNKPVGNLIKTNISKAEELIRKGESASGEEMVKDAIKVLDSAVSKGVIRKNNASRRKSRLMKKLNAAKGLTK
ncbi:MAG: 30S ribosomal protein S20 [Chloroflexi bacterium]|nr:30S ribosomal protein S20 [Chloroflexota bacterium]